VTLDPRATPVSPGALREAARRQARGLSLGLVIAAGVAVSLVLVTALIALDYRYDQASHRLFKLVIGLSGVVTILLVPRLGLFLLPLAVVFLGWMPRSPVPVLNALNILVFAVFSAWLVGRALRREPLARGGHLGVAIALFLTTTLLMLGRGIALPVTADFEAASAAQAWFRNGVPMLMFFMALSMLRGAADRRRMAVILVLALGVEGAATLALGGNGPAGRAVGTFDQPNITGAFLAIFVCLGAALVSGVRHWAARAAMLGATVLGAIAIFPTLSRGAVIAAIVGLFYVLARSSRLMTAGLVLVLLTAPLWAPADLKDRILSTQVEVEGTDEVELEASAQKRLTTWTVIMRVVAEHPLDGVGYTGLGNVLVAEGVAQGIEGIARTAHNSWLRMLGEGGIFGLLAMIWLFWTCWRVGAAGVRRATHRFDRQVAIGFGGAVLALAVSCWFGERLFEIAIVGNFWLLAAIVQDLVLDRSAAPAAGARR
jgi:O-antigen ligase